MLLREEIKASYGRVFKSFWNRRQSKFLLAKQLNKPVPEFRIDCPNHLYISPKERVLAGIMVHLIRNSLDHGIESGSAKIG